MTLRPSRRGRASARFDRALTERTLRREACRLALVDPDLGAVVAAYGPPPLWGREPGFATLLHVILEQQVSLASARAAFERVRAIAAPLSPSSFLALDDGTLKRAGFSRQKTRYGRILASAIADGSLDLDAVAALPDDEAKAELTKLVGVGAWTADIYLLMALRRPDVWPAGDLALAVAARDVKQLDRRQSPRELDALAEPWRPFRAVAARILWHHYLSRRSRA